MTAARAPDLSSLQQQHPQQSGEAPAAAVRYASTDDFSGKVEIYRGRHSVVWNVVCRATRRPLILKGYMKVGVLRALCPVPCALQQQRVAVCPGLCSSSFWLCALCFAAAWHCEQLGETATSLPYSNAPKQQTNPPPPHTHARYTHHAQAKMTERNFHQVRREIRLMQQISYEGAVRLQGTFEDGSAIYLVQEICAKVSMLPSCWHSVTVRDSRGCSPVVYLVQKICACFLSLLHLLAADIFCKLQAADPPAASMTRGVPALQSLTQALQTS